MEHEDDAATGAEDDLLMKVEEQIFTQVAEDESDGGSGDEMDAIVVTCGKLIISAPVKDVKGEKQEEDLDDEDLIQAIEKDADAFFKIKSIEKVDEEDFEAVFEVNSDIDEIGLSESDIKVLELLESKDFIVLTDHVEKPETDDFSSSVLKFQDAIENYTKSIFGGTSDTIIALEKVTGVQNDKEEKGFSESVLEVQDLYGGRTPIIEEPFEEIKMYVCEESENSQDSNNLKLFNVETSVDNVSNENEEICLEAIDKINFDIADFDTGRNNEIDINSEKLQLETNKESDNIESIISVIINEKEEIIDEVKSLNSFEINEKIFDDEFLNKSKSIEDKLYSEKLEYEEIEQIIKTSEIPELLGLSNCLNLEKETNLIRKPTNNSEVIEVFEYKNDSVEIFDHSSENEENNLIIENVVANEFETSESIINQDLASNQAHEDKNIKNKGLQRNAESRKSKRNKKIHNAEQMHTESSFIPIEKATTHIDEMKLLVNSILFVALAIFLFLICGDTSSYHPLSEEDMDTLDTRERIPASVSSIVEGYVQLSGLAEMELRK